MGCFIVLLFDDGFRGGFDGCLVVVVGLCYFAWLDVVLFCFFGWLVF